MNVKRCLCLFLVLCALISLFPASVIAAGTEDDTTLPEIRHMELSATEVVGMPSTVEVIIDAYDSQSGVEYVSALFSTIGSDSYSILGEVHLHTYYYDQDTKQYTDYPDGKWHGFIQIPAGCEPGDYVVENLRIQDAANNLADYCRTAQREGTVQMPPEVMDLTLTVTEGDLLTAKQEKTYTKYGKTAKVTVDAAGVDLQYQWYVKNNNQSAYSKVFVNDPTYSVTMNTTSKKRSVYCVVTDRDGLARTSNIVTLRLAPTIVTEPVDKTVAMGETVKVSIEAEGDGLSYQWYIKNAGKEKFSKSSLTTPTYSCTMSEKVDGRQIYCVVTDEYGNTAKTKTALLKAKQVKKTAAIITEPKTTYTKSGETVKVTLKAEGDGLTYQWYIKNAGKDKYSKSSVTSATYSTTMSEKSKDRLLYCVVKDKYGNSVKSKKVALRMAATITTQPKSVSVLDGAAVSTNVQAVGDSLTYQWYVKNVGSDSFKASKVTSSTYSTTMSEKADGRKIYCVVTDKYGKTAKSKTVTLSMDTGMKLTQKAVIEEESYLDVSAYSSFLKSMKKQAVIPGLNQHYVPQGITVSESTGLIYISAYYKKLNSDGKKESVVMVLKDGKLVAEYHLFNKDNSAMSGHVGGVAVTDTTLFVAWGDSDVGTIAAIPLSSLKTSGSQAVKLSTSYKVPVKTAFLSYHDGYLWVGNFYEPDDPKNRYDLCPEMNYKTDGYGTYILGYNLTKKGNDRLLADKDHSYAKPDCVLAAPVRVQGMVYDQDTNTVVLSRSYKRNANKSATAELNYYTVDLDSACDKKVKVDGRKVACYILNADRLNKTVKSLPMNEGIALDASGYLWVVHESGAGVYRNDGGDYPTDRLWRSKNPLS